MTPLTKTLFLAGAQCPKRLWWQAHEPRATELAPSETDELRRQLGTELGQRAQGLHPGGVAIAVAHASREHRAAATREAMRTGAPAIFEATFLADGFAAAVDILYREGDGWVLREVKSALDVKDDYVLDATFQRQVLAACGVEVARVEILHLNRDHRHPGPAPLFHATDVTTASDALRDEVAHAMHAQRAVLGRPLPDVAIGPHCETPHDCPFRARCWPRLPPHHVSTTYYAGKRWWEWQERGWQLVTDVPDAELRKPQAKRQKRAIAEGRMIVEDGLAEALRAFRRPLAFLDFETAMLTVPAWDGCMPLEQLPVQFSCHVEDGAGGLRHVEYLAPDGGDCRRELAEALLEACDGAASVVAYYAQFEKKCLQHLAAAVPDLAPALEGVIARLVDPLPVVRDHVYHPDFSGSFSLKKVLPALVPDLTYDGLEIAEGETASARLLRLLFRPDELDPADAARTRAALLEYCRIDTLAMVRLLARIEGLAPTS